MPRKRQSPEEIEAMRERILAAAHDLMHEGGHRAVSMRAIAARLGVSPMTLYHYFPSREALINTLSERQYMRIQACRERAYQEAEEGDPWPVVERELTRYLTFARERPRMYRLAFVLPTETEQPPERLLKRIAEDRQHLARLLRLGMEKGAFRKRDPEVAAATLFSIIHGPLMLLHNGRLPQELGAAIIEEVLTMIRHYLHDDLAATEASPSSTGALQGVAEAPSARRRG
jgi:AcrR family transcriptional regulator